MKKILLWIALSLMTAAQGASLDSGTSISAELKPSQQQAQAAHLAAELLSRYHYRPMPLDEAMSKRIFEHYLKSLDPEKLYFAQTDIDHLADIRTRFGTAIIEEDLTIPFAIFNLYTRRVSERLSYARSLLKDEFDFRQKENYQYAREKGPWLKSEVEMRDLWRKRVKNDWLRLKLAGKNDIAMR
jgi:carboxyl-terminal processing protease